MNKKSAGRGSFFRASRLNGETVTRSAPCVLCRSREATRIGRVRYWDLSTNDLVACSACGHTQLDPMLTGTAMKKGCQAYHLLEIRSASGDELRRNLLRAYRRGVVFAADLRRAGFNPKRILEFGPGSGYFSAGIAKIFPAAEITVVDLVDDVLRRNEEDHGFRTIEGAPESARFGDRRKSFDLVIARDVMEHTADPAGLIARTAELLSRDGLFHFMVPNGREDAWGHLLRWKRTALPSELLLNHVQYFDGESLLAHLNSAGFEKIRYYTFGLKSTWRGKGWNTSAGRAAPAATGRSADRTIAELSGNVREIFVEKKEVLDTWYLRAMPEWIALAVCRWKHRTGIRLDPRRRIGHEIYGLFRLR